MLQPSAAGVQRAPHLIHQQLLLLSVQLLLPHPLLLLLLLWQEPQLHHLQLRVLLWRCQLRALPCVQPAARI
jgi:hypothetical protein